MNPWRKSERVLAVAPVAKPSAPLWLIRQFVRIRNVFSLPASVGTPSVNQMNGKTITAVSRSGEARFYDRTATSQLGRRLKNIHREISRRGEISNQHVAGAPSCGASVDRANASRRRSRWSCDIPRARDRHNRNRRTLGNTDRQSCNAGARYPRSFAPARNQPDDFSAPAALRSDCLRAI